MDNATVVLRLKKTIVYMDKVLDNYPKKEFVLKERISNCLYDILELSYLSYYHSNDLDTEYLKNILTKLKMLDFYIKNSYDKGIISRKKLTNLGVHLRDITNMYYAWVTKIEKKK